MDEPRPLTSAIVPIHNAQKSVAKVVRTLLASDLVDEVICVDVGSTDDSLSILRSFGRAIVLVESGPTRYRGKGEAVAAGVWRANGTIVVFVDPSLTTLTDVHLRALMEPLYAGTTRAVLGLTPGESPFAHLVARLAGARFTTERACLRGDLLRHLLRMAKTGSGGEAYLSSVCQDEETLVVPLAGLQRLGRQGELTRVDAAREWAGEAVAIARVVFPRTLEGARGRPGPGRARS